MRIVVHRGLVIAIAHRTRDRQFLSSFGTVLESERNGFVVPSNPLKRFFFKTIRRIVRDDHPIAEWTRHWKGPWVVQVENQTFGPFKHRFLAVLFEEDYMLKKILKEIQNENHEPPPTDHIIGRS